MLVVKMTVIHRIEEIDEHISKLLKKCIALDKSSHLYNELLSTGSSKNRS